MKIDRYTKTVLTVIALCLVWICLRDSVMTPPVSAQSKTGAAEVIIAGVKSGIKMPVSIQDISVPDPYNLHRSGRINWLPIGGNVTTR